jgi:diacylglycerol kinase family enzyme
MVGRDVPVAVLPTGTANNIARSLGLLKRPFEELVDGWREARRVRLDVGIASGPWGQRYFVEGLGRTRARRRRKPRPRARPGWSTARCAA